MGNPKYYPPYYSAKNEAAKLAAEQKAKRDEHGGQAHVSDCNSWNGRMTSNVSPDHKRFLESGVRVKLKNRVNHMSYTPIK